MAEPLDRSRLTSADERTMASVTERLARFGFVVERSTGRGFDGYRLRPSASPMPKWIVLRWWSGKYQLRDHMLHVLAEGSTLAAVLFPEWLPSCPVVETRGGDLAPVPPDVDGNG